jgi:hypothetical protein
MMSLKEIMWENPDKMHIETGHKTFDKQTVIITTGNVIAPTMYGTCVRSYHTYRNPVGQPCNPGKMQEFDLCSYGLRSMPEIVRRAVVQFSLNRDVWVYEIFHSYRPRIQNTWTRGYRLGEWTKWVHGYLVTTMDHKQLYMWVCQDSFSKSFGVMAEVRKYLVDQEEEAVEIIS